jgi:sec-independent protein translocase protein TatB
MFDIGGSELLLIVIVAIVVIGPKDLPRAMRLAGQWIAKVRRVSGHFRAGIETMIREAELEEMERKWREQNEAILKEHPPEAGATSAAATETALLAPSREEMTPVAKPAQEEQGEPQLPLPPP